MRYLLVFGLLAVSSLAQTLPSAEQSSSLAEAATLYATGNFGPVVPSELEQIKGGNALPVFERRFPLLPDPDLQLVWAAELVRLGERDDRYWNLLAAEMLARLNSNVTDHEPVDLLTGKPINPELGYVVRHHPRYGEDYRSPATQDTLACQSLKLAGDPRAIPLLRNALDSPRESLRSCAAWILAERHDAAAIPRIVASIERSPAGHRESIARGLLSPAPTLADPAFVAAARPFVPELNPDAFGKFKAGDNFPGTLELLASEHVIAAIPLLKARFEAASAASAAATKGELAGALVRLVPGELVYWNYVAAQCRLAVESDAPSPFTVSGMDAQGKPSYSPEFLAWAEKHHVEVTNGDDPFYQLPGAVMNLARLGDPRGIPLLREGLLSQTPLIQSSAAMGLAQIPDKASIPLILAAIKRNPVNAATIAMFALSYFDDDEAQAEVRLCFPGEPPGVWEELKKNRGTRPFDPRPAPGQPLPQR